MKRWIHSAEDYFGYHRPGSHVEFPDEVASMDKMTDSDYFPEDILDKPRSYFPDFNNFSDSRAMIAKLKVVQGKPNAKITIYRGDPSSGNLNTGDWVTPSLEYAKAYTGDGFYSGSTDSVVHQYTVRVGDLSFDGDSIFEFDYWGPPIVEKQIKEVH